MLQASAALAPVQSQAGAEVGADAYSPPKYTLKRSCPSSFCPALIVYYNYQHLRKRYNVLYNVLYNVGFNLFIRIFLIRLRLALLGT